MRRPQHAPMSRICTVTGVVAAAVACAATAPAADASRFNPSAHFSVTVSGQVDESWSYSRDGSDDRCAPLTQGSGSAQIKFAAPKAVKRNVTLYDGIRGSVPVSVTRTREGSLRTS